MLRSMADLPRHTTVFVVIVICTCFIILLSNKLTSIHSKIHTNQFTAVEDRAITDSNHADSSRITEAGIKASDITDTQSKRHVIHPKQERKQSKQSSNRESQGKPTNAKVIGVNTEQDKEHSKQQEIPTQNDSDHAAPSAETHQTHDISNDIPTIQPEDKPETADSTGKRADQPDTSNNIKLTPNINAGQDAKSTKTTIHSKDQVLSSGKPQRLNVLFIMADDMRAQISPYDGPHSTFTKPKLFTPNFDRLASKSLLMKNMFVQYSLCGPSRASMLTSRRPDTTKVYDNDHYWRTEGGDFTTMPQYFKDSGYYTYGLGKLFHKGLSSNNNDPISWSEKYKKLRSSDKKHMERVGDTDGAAGWLAVEQKAEEDMPLSDSVAVEEIKELLSDLAPNALTGKQPFFLGLGFKKPHLSFVCPEKYFQMYPLEEADQYLSEQSWQQPVARRGCNLRNVTRTDNSQGYIPDKALRYLRQAYFACISYVDTLLGDVLDAVDALGLANTTLVAFIADHGYHLGENGFFGKQRLRDSCTRVPMMVHIPGVTDQGIISQSVSEAVDVFPTIAEAAGLKPLKKCPVISSDVSLCTQGKSLIPLIANPDSETDTYAVTQVKAGSQFMRYSIRTENYRYSQWAELVTDNGAETYVLMENETSKYPSELFDLIKDREERFNLTSDPKYESIKLELKEMLRKKITL